MSEPRDIRIKRLRMRAMRRGIREMDMILSAWADAHLESLPDDRLDLFDSLLSENDQDLYAWVTGRAAPPDHLAAMVLDVAQIFQKQG